MCKRRFTLYAMIWVMFGFSGMVLPKFVLAQAVDRSMSQASHSAPELLLAKILPAHVNVESYLVSEKFDGVRAYWDGRVLRFRGGGIVAAPAWFIQALPKRELDGELWTGRGQFERTSGIVRQSVPNDADWRQVNYLIFELPNAKGSFSERAEAIQSIVQQAKNPQLIAVKQFKVAHRQALLKQLDDVLRKGGEGLMLHLASAPYETGRSDVLYKLKPLQDDEAIVQSYLPGQGKYVGQVGALLVRTADGREFKVGGGLSDAQRLNPPKIGETITYQFNGLTKSGMPRFPRFLRIRAGL